MLKVQDIISSAQEISAGLSDGRYVAARPVQFSGLFDRLSDAWQVFIGNADAVKWEGQ